MLRYRGVYLPMDEPVIWDDQWNQEAFGVITADDWRYEIEAMLRRAPPPPIQASPDEMGDMAFVRR